MKTVRMLRLICLVMFCISLVLMLQIPTWLRLQKNEVADPAQTPFLTMKNNDLVQGEISYVLGCAPPNKTASGVPKYTARAKKATMCCGSHWGK